MKRGERKFRKEQEAHGKLSTQLREGISLATTYLDDGAAYSARRVLMDSVNNSTWTKRYPRKPGYYFFYSPELEDTFLIEMSGRYSVTPRKNALSLYLIGDPLSKGRSWLEQKYGYGLFYGPILIPQPAPREAGK